MAEPESDIERGSRTTRTAIAIATELGGDADDSLSGAHTDSGAAYGDAGECVVLFARLGGGDVRAIDVGVVSAIVLAAHTLSRAPPSSTNHNYSLAPRSIFTTT